MKTFVHPHKGYLNTKYRLSCHGSETLDYSVYPMDEAGVEKSALIQGVVMPYSATEIEINHPGKSKIVFSNGEEHTIEILDGLKFGGSTHKKSYISEKSNWCFVVMRDRTYFYNRETCQQYVEPIAPDEIIFLDASHILLENNHQYGKTLYSLTQHAPVLYLENYIFCNENYIVWEEESTSDSIKLLVYSVEDECIKFDMPFDVYTFDRNKQWLVIERSNTIFTFNLSDRASIPTKRNYIGEFITFFDGDNYIAKKDSILRAYNAGKDKYFSYIKEPALISGINEVTFIDLEERKEIYNRIKKEFAPEATITSVLVGLDFFYAISDIFYFEKTIKLSTKHYRPQLTLKLKNLHDFEIELNEGFWKTISGEEWLLVYKNDISYLVSKDVDGQKTIINHGCIYNNGNRPILVRNEPNGKSLYIINGKEWQKVDASEFNVSYYEKWGVVEIDKNYYMLGELGNIELVGSNLVKPNYGVSYVTIDDVRFYEHGGRIVRDKWMSDLSENQKLGICFKDGKPWMIDFECNPFYEVQILKEVFDSSRFLNSLISENGNEILYRDGMSTRIMNLLSGAVRSFNNLSYVKLENGQPTTFAVDDRHQVRITNPVTGLSIPKDRLREARFVSPDNSLYATTDKYSYIKYFDEFQRNYIETSEYNQLSTNFAYPQDTLLLGENHASVSAVYERRKQFMRERMSWLKHKLADRGWNPRSDEEWYNTMCSFKATRYSKDFLSYFFEERSFKEIKSAITDQVVATIPLGPALWFLNYVSFSYDGRFVALGGRYPDHSHDEKGNSIGGLLLCYDLAADKIVFQQTNSDAVWKTTFSKLGDLGSYSSEPTCFITKAESLASSKSDALDRQIGVSFLCFSPDGKYYALTKQGYIRKDNDNEDWGHQPSTEVIVCDRNSLEVIRFNDLADIERVSNGNYVSSVSFSNDNKRLLMVGNDGVMIIRNLKL